jgi:hypothetical protein
VVSCAIFSVNSQDPEIFKSFIRRKTVDYGISEA